ncbi:hypothetical protein [Streptomyces sp. SJL17-1]|uniref:RapZ C-terminal domain-containing protein n=1 Tax=Streptomyces sp. SJL17-1 TaxID=2967223 RepID=UPI0029675888|nr:hypothetical protein [Streptomyces sp. SJL17-1]
MVLGQFLIRWPAVCFCCAGPRSPTAAPTPPSWEHLRGGATVTQVELALDKADAVAAALRVFAHFLKTPGALTLINRTAVQLRSLADEVPVGRLVRLTVACQGGRHRSVAAAETIGRLIWEAWDGEYGVEIEHHHIDHPVLLSSPPA